MRISPRTLVSGLAMRATASPSILPVMARNLRFESHGVRVIDHIDLTLLQGGCTAIMGYNGAGKSVLVRLLHGLLTPTGGSVTWAGGLSGRELRARQAMVFQHPVLLRRSVEQNVRYAMKVRGKTGPDDEEHLESLLEDAGLQRLARHPARLLSGGEKQRLAVVRALSVRPEILFLDEPTASLDPASTGTVERLISTAQDEGTKIVLITQSIGQARRLADDVVFVHRGRVTEHVSADDFFRGPESAAARAFVEGRIDVWNGADRVATYKEDRLA